MTCYKQYTKAVTNEYREGGFGDQYLTIINAIIYAFNHQLPFVYSPLREIWYKVTDLEVLSKTEKLLNLIDHFPLNRDLSFQKRNSLHSITCQAYFDNNIEVVTNQPVFRKIQKLFFSNKDKSKYFNNKNLNIAVHIRRSQKVEDGGGMHFHFSDKIYLKMIEVLRKKYALDSPLIHIYSIGDEEHFRKTFQADDVVLHINKSTEDTFTSMAFADVLLIAVSGLSQAAALLSSGVVYYIPFWHAPRAHWISWETLYPLNLPQFTFSMGGRNTLIDI